MPRHLPPRQLLPRHLVASLAAGLALGLVAIAPLEAATAASACRALANSDACAAVAECTWVAAYKTKKGKEIAAYCRIKRKASVASSGPSNGRAPGGTASTASSAAN